MWPRGLLASVRGATLRNMEDGWVGVEVDFGCWGGEILVMVLVVEEGGFVGGVVVEGGRL